MTGFIAVVKLNYYPITMIDLLTNMRKGISSLCGVQIAPMPLLLIIMESPLPITAMMRNLMDIVYGHVVIVPKKY
jgi:hypothetical protein